MKVRSKGHQGEREAALLLKEHLGERVYRNVDQVRNGGADIFSLPPFAIEVKRCEQLNFTSWKKQAIGQTNKSNPIPVIMFRQNRKKWRILIPFDVVSKKKFRLKNSWIEIDFDTFLHIVRVIRDRDT